MAPRPVLGEDDLARVDALLADADAALAARFPGDAGTRQPVHTAYVPADRVGPGLAADWGREALAALEQHGGGAGALAELLDLAPPLVEEVLPRVVAKLGREPVEDLRADLEDGYGPRPDAEEDAHAVAAATALAVTAADDHGPPFRGVRVKSLEAPTRRRGLRSLDLVLGAWLDAGGDPLGLTTTLPKVTSVEQVEALVAVCEALERGHGLDAGALRFELQVETPQAVQGPDGTALVARMVHASGGRCSGLHYGTYDYSAALGVAAAHQRSDHPVADHAKHVMVLAAAGTGARVSDGSSNVLPVGTRDDVRAAWALHARLVRRALETGLYQGWDLHPAQLVTRYLATYAFFRSALPAAGDRLRRYAERSGGGVLDEPATAQALASVVVRGLDCGAVDEAEATAATGLPRTALVAYARRIPAGGLPGAPS